MARLANIKEGARVQVRPGGQFAIVVGFVPGLDERKGRVLLTDDVDGKTAVYSVPSENVKEVI